jgi:hypothetical protein
VDRSRLGWGSVLCRFSEPGVSAFAAPTEVSRSRDGIVACGRKWRFGEEYATACTITWTTARACWESFYHSQMSEVFLKRLHKVIVKSCLSFNRGILVCLYVSLCVGLDVEGETSARGVSWRWLGSTIQRRDCQRDLISQQLQEWPML